MSHRNSFVNGQNAISLIPFQVLEMSSSIAEIPSGVKLIHAPSVWEKSEKGKDIVIAVLDTGCNTEHIDLKDRIIGGYNFTTDYESDPNNFLDNHGHGTHVAGIIAASENNTGVIGVAPLAKLLILKVFDGKGKSSNEWITDGIINAINWRGPKGEKVRIISMSLSGKKDAYCLHEAIKLAVNNNILVVCAAGNDGDCREETNELRYPGAYQEVVEVGSVDINKKIACKSNSNNHLDLVAPGEEIWSTDKDGGYAKLSGTSMATPHVSGAAALIIKQSEKEFKRILSESEIYAQLIKRTTNIGYSPFLVGNGMVDLSREC